MATVVLPRDVADQLASIRASVADIIPGGRDPERSYMAKHEALRLLDRLGARRG